MLSFLKTTCLFNYRPVRVQLTLQQVQYLRGPAQSAARGPPIGLLRELERKTGTYMDIDCLGSPSTQGVVRAGIGKGARAPTSIATGMMPAVVIRGPPENVHVRNCFALRNSLLILIIHICLTLNSIIRMSASLP